MENLFSVVVLCYRHFEYVYEAIDSVLEQDYPAIELIVSDDGSLNFPEKEIRNYVNKQKKQNIVRFAVRHEKENCGTVKHLNRAIKACTGDYIIALAGDDVLADTNVLSTYKTGFMHAEDTCYIQMAQTGMYDEKLEKLETYYLKGTTQKAIEKTSETTQPLLKQLIIYGPCLPSTSTCFKREFFEKFGSFDEEYKLIEDYPMHFRLAKEGWIIHYENFVAIKHRHGGISHGQKGALTQSSVMYYKDLRRMIADIVMKNLDILSHDEAEQVRNYRKKELQWIDFHLAKLNRKYGSILMIALRNPFLSLRQALEWAYPTANKMKKLLYVCCALWLTIPDIERMISFVLMELGVETVGFIQPALYLLSTGVFVVGAVAFLIWAANNIMWRLERFPQESIVVG